jgi:hypothetical protein
MLLVMRSVLCTGLIASVMLASCASPRSPEFSVAGARVGETSSTGTAMVFTLDARNDNDVALPLRDVNYTVELNGQRVFTGTRSAEATLRRLGTQQVTLPAVVNHAASGPVRPGAGGRVPYRIYGEVTYVTPGQIAEILFDSGVRVPRASFSATGEIELPG